MSVYIVLTKPLNWGLICAVRIAVGGRVKCPTGSSAKLQTVKTVNNMNRIKKLWALLMVSLVALCALPMQAQITNPDFSGVSTTVSGGFNVGMGLAVAAAVALLVFGFFFRSARKRG